MIINLTNKPVKEWPESQRHLAEFLFGDIVDMKYSEISEDDNTEDIKLAAEKCFDEIIGLISTPYDGVVIDGNLIFSYYLINKLLEFGINCYIPLYVNNKYIKLLKL